MQDSEKYAILTAIRDNLARARHAGATPAHSVESDERRARPPAAPGQDALVRQFLEELRALRAHAVLARTSEAARTRLREIVLGHEARRVAISSAPLLASLEVESLLIELGVEVIALPTDTSASERDAYLRRLMTADVGITGADFGLAESGTLVVQGGRREGRLISLVPPVHVALLRTDQLLPGVADLISRLETPPRTSGVFLITGPSRTADIEQTLTVGVHGPKELHVLLLEQT